MCWDGDYLSNFHVCGSTCSSGMRVQEDIIMCFRCLMFSLSVVSCYFYFVLLPLGPELW